MRPLWFAAALGLRLVLRPLVITRPIGPEEILGTVRGEDAPQIDGAVQSG